jgi:hypothetical protein
MTGKDSMNISPAYLFVGSKQTTHQEALLFLQQTFCLQNACGDCTTCLQLIQKQHHGAIWIEPEKRYNLEELEIISKTATFSLDEDEHCFFIITKADFLSPACANSLLKLVEEPPTGYHFLFLAERLSQVLPTIRSRCTQKVFHQKGDTEELPFIVKQFMRFDTDPITFSQEIGKCSMTEQECIAHIDELLEYWISVYKRVLTKNNPQQEKASLAMITILKNAIQKPPAPGSAKIFWKNLFLQKEQISL